MAHILVTGGAGYIGSVVSADLLAAGHRVFVLDNLVKGWREAVPRNAAFEQVDLGDGGAVREVMRRHGIDAVVHMAAYSLVGESVEQPSKYYHNNLTLGLELLDAMVATGVRALVFSSTAAVYGNPEQQPIHEDDPLAPTNPYGETKLACERALSWFGRAHGWRHASLRYFNAAGAAGHLGERHEPETHLIPLVLAVAAGLSPYVTVFGDDYPTRDGICVRDYIHVADLAAAHVLALESLMLDDGHREVVFNIGCGGDGYTVKEVIDTAARVTGRSIATRLGPRRAGDPAALVAGSDKIARELGWAPKQQDLTTIVKSAWEWMQSSGARDHGGAAHV